MKKIWCDDAWDDYLWWQENDKIAFKQINKLINDIDRNKNIGLGHPEPLKGELSGFYTRQINKKDRIIYKIINNTIEILSCKGHYNDK